MLATEKLSGNGYDETFVQFYGFLYLLKVCSKLYVRFDIRCVLPAYLTLYMHQWSTLVACSVNVYVVDIYGVNVKYIDTAKYVYLIVCVTVKSLRWRP